jgi:SsrA-binding protein
MTLIEDKKLHLEYQIHEHFEAGIELLGHEVKSVKAKLGGVAGARVVARGGEAYVLNLYIPAYQPKNNEKGYDEFRTRRLLLHKKEIAQIYETEQIKGLTTLVKRLYLKGRQIKCEVVIVSKLKKHDKREKEKEKNWRNDRE